MVTDKEVAMANDSSKRPASRKEIESLFRKVKQTGVAIRRALASLDQKDDSKADHKFLRRKK